MVESGMMPEVITNDGDEAILQEDECAEDDDVVDEGADPDDIEEGDDADLEE
jgi:hypothetical protein